MKPLAPQNLRAIIPLLVLMASAIIAGCAESTNAPTWETLTASAVRALKAAAPEEAERLCNTALKTVAEPAPGDTRLARTHSLMGEILRWQKKYELAEQSFKQAVLLCEKAVGTNHTEMISPLESLANFYYYTKIQYDQVAPLYQRILNIVEQAPELNNFEIASRARNLADVFLLLKQPAQAEPLYWKALNLTEQSPHSDEGEIVQYLHSLVELYRKWSKYDQAEPLAKRALVIRQKTTGPDAELAVVVCLDKLGELYLAWSKGDPAEIYFRQALIILQKTVDANSLDLSPRLIGLGDALQIQGKLDYAEAQYQRALQITETNLGHDFIEVAAILEKCAAVLHDQKKKRCRQNPAGPG